MLNTAELSAEGDDDEKPVLDARDRDHGVAALATVTLVGCHAARSRVPGAARRAAAAR